MIQKNLRNTLLVLVLFPTTCVYAQDEHIPCPSISLIHSNASKIDKVGKVRSDTKYNAWTNNYAFVENNISWSIEVNRIEAASSEDALQKGIKIVLNTTFKEHEEALVVSQYYICNYGPEDVGAIGRKSY